MGPRPAPTGFTRFLAIFFTACAYAVLVLVFAALVVLALWGLLTLVQVTLLA